MITHPFLRRRRFGRMMQWLDSDAGFRWALCPAFTLLVLTACAAISGAVR